MAASSAPQPSMRAARRWSEHELDLLESAVALVANGGASRVALIIGDKPPVHATARVRAGQRGVILREVKRADGNRDIVVEPAQ